MEGLKLVNVVVATLMRRIGRLQVARIRFRAHTMVKHNVCKGCCKTRCLRQQQGKAGDPKRGEWPLVLRCVHPWKRRGDRGHATGRQADESVG